MVLESEEEEEKTRLLSDSACNSPARTGSTGRGSTAPAGHGPVGCNSTGRGSASYSVRPAEDQDSVFALPRLGWQLQHQHQGQLLQLGPAEKTFLAMSGVLPSPGAPRLGLGGEINCDSNAQVPDSIQVVRNILTELEADTEGDSQSYSTCLESQEIYQDYEEGECTCHSELGPSVGTQGSLVVDIHQEGSVARCSKHTAERFPRCYSESHRQRDRIREGIGRERELNNLDKIETVGEFGVDRLRHFSESAVGVGKRRRATFSTELKQLRKSLISVGRNQQMVEKEGDLEAPPIHGSTETFSADVRFDIWEAETRPDDESPLEREEEREEGEGDDDEFQENFQFVPHELVTSLRTGVCPPPINSLSHSSSTTSMPICRICQLPSIEPHNPLISPCRCLGSIRFVHNPCLMKWLEVSSKKNSDPPGCELCQYQYIRHKKFVISNWLLPSCSSKDKVLHSVFMAAIAIMISCSIVTILCFKQNEDIQPRVGPNTELSASELMTLSCGVVFFLAFFVAMYVEVKAENTIYQLICKFFYMNHEWTIEEYDRRRDPAKQLDSP